MTDKMVRVQCLAAILSFLNYHQNQATLFWYKFPFQSCSSIFNSYFHFTHIEEYPIPYFLGFHSKFSYIFRITYMASKVLRRSEQVCLVLLRLSGALCHSVIEEYAKEIIHWFVCCTYLTFYNYCEYVFVTHIFVYVSGFLLISILSRVCRVEYEVILLFFFLCNDILFLGEHPHNKISSNPWVDRNQYICTWYADKITSTAGKT